MSVSDEQQFCLRWNNFQANITSQFEALRDDEDFTDVTIACEGQRIQAHKVVLSACSPYFKDLFKSNPCPHPIIFMRDVEVQHIAALMEFMYAGEVNVAQAHLSAFLKTAESLRIRGLTDTSAPSESGKDREEDTVLQNALESSFLTNQTTSARAQISSTNNVSSSQDIRPSQDKSCTPPPKRQCKTERNETELSRLKQLAALNEDSISVNPFTLPCDDGNVREISKSPLMPKMELPDYISDDDRDETIANFYHSPDVTELTGGMEIIPQTSNLMMKENNIESHSGPLRFRRRRNCDQWIPFDFHDKMKTNSSTEEINSRLRECQDNIDPNRRNRLVKLGEGIEIYEDQLRSVKWSDYRKLTRGLATILFSPAELATCSVTGQRWSRAGSGERPVKPALDRAKVQAIISYVATRFPMVEISRIKQVLAYKCKENSTALKMKSVRYFGDQAREPDRS